MNDSKEELVDKDEVVSFYETFIHSDGVMMAHMIKSAAGTIVLLDVLGKLWFDFKKLKKTRMIDSR